MADQDFATDPDEVEAALIAILGRAVGFRMDGPGFDIRAEVEAAALVVRGSDRDDRHARTIRLVSAGILNPL